MITSKKIIFIIGFLIFVILTTMISFVVNRPIKFNDEVKPFGIKIGEPLKKQIKEQKSKFILKPTWPSKPIKDNIRGNTSKVILNLSFIEWEYKRRLIDSDIQFSNCKKDDLNKILFENIVTSFFKGGFKEHTPFYCFKLERLPISLGVISYVGYYTNYSSQIVRPTFPEPCENKYNRIKMFNLNLDKYKRWEKENFAYDYKNLTYKYGTYLNPFSGYKANIITPSGKQITITQDTQSDFKNLEYKWKYDEIFYKDKDKINNYLQCVNENYIDLRKDKNPKLNKSYKPRAPKVDTSNLKIQKQIEKY